MNADFPTLFGAVAPVFLIVGSGYAIRRIGWLNAEADASLMRVIVNVLFPCLILDTILGNSALAKTGNVFLAPAVGFGTVLAGFFLSYLAAPLFGIRESRQRRSFAFTAGLYNYGYVPLPLIQKLFDPETTAVLFVHNVGVEICLWSAGIIMLAGSKTPDGQKFHPRQVFNAPVLAILSALALHFAGARYWLPHVVLSASHSLGAAAIPLGLVLTGATFADQMRQLSVRNGLGISVGALVLRTLALPLCMLALARWLPCPIELRRIIVIQSAMPSAVIPVLICKHYEGDPAVAMRIVLVTSSVALVSIPLWIQLGLWWIQ